MGIFWNQMNGLLLVVGFSLSMFVYIGGAAELMVGGSKGWNVPSDANAQSFNQWAESRRFQIGDSLLFVYQANEDSVLRVTREDYNNCNTKNPIESFTDGRTSYKLSSSGSHYFISGVEDNCKKNEKMVVVVLADRSGGSSGTIQPGNSGSMGTQTPSNPSNNGASISSSSSSLILLFKGFLSAVLGSVFFLV